MYRTNIYKPLFFIFVTFFLIIISSFITLYITKNKNTISSQRSTKILTTVNKTENWKIYTDTVYKFSLKYPSSWKQAKLEDNIILNLISPEWEKDIQNPNRFSQYEEILGDHFTIRIYSDYKISLTENKSLEEFLSDKSYFNKFEKIKIGNSNGYKVEVIAMIDHPAYYIVERDNLLIIDDINFSTTELQILDTFNIDK